MTATGRPAANHEVSIVRDFDAPREMVFAAWTRPEHLACWWGPKDFSVSYLRFDVRAGGEYRACIRSPEGAEYWMRGVYRDVTPPERLVFTFAWEDDDGGAAAETLVTVTFDPQGAGTRMRFRQTFLRSTEERDAHESGWRECFERLDHHLETSLRAGT